MGLLVETSWSVKTTEEISVSAMASVLRGKMWLVNGDSGEELVLKYRCISFGAGKGLPVGAQWSNTSDPSGGFNNVGVRQGRVFSSSKFPCYGYMIGAGGSAGVIGSVLGMDITGGGVTAVIFGMDCFAGVRIWGFGRGALPGLGLSAGLASYSLESDTYT